ncbi:MAG: hypothetical protein ACI3VP_07905 [Oscillospiraceae bacterium]
MKYFERIMEILQKATVEEVFMVLRFAENVVVVDQERNEEGEIHS